MMLSFEILGENPLQLSNLKKLVLVKAQRSWLNWPNFSKAEVRSKNQAPKIFFLLKDDL